MMENKKKLSLDEIKNIEAQILKDFADFCQSNNLKYYLGYGTLLGAARHKGFIPWDDDVDVLMPRADYNKFIKLTGYNPIKPNLETRFYRDCAHPNIYPFAKVIDINTIVYEKGKAKKNISGLWIDIFPLDGYPEKQEEADLLFKKHLEVRHAYDLAITNPFYVRQNLLKKCIKVFIVPFMKLYGISNFCKQIDSIGQTYSFDDCQKVTDFTWPDNSHTWIFKNELEPSTELEFEGNLYKVPGNYKAYLTRIYGDYMQLPPESERIPHGFLAFKL